MRRAAGPELRSLFVDTSPRPSPIAAELAAAMRANYVALPFADAKSLSRVVGAATRGGR
jgi:magnesium chelatase subunit D